MWINKSNYFIHDVLVLIVTKIKEQDRILGRNCQKKIIIFTDYKKTKGKTKYKIPTLLLCLCLYWPTCLRSLFVRIVNLQKARLHRPNSNPRLLSIIHNFLCLAAVCRGQRQLTSWNRGFNVYQPFTSLSINMGMYAKLLNPAFHTDHADLASPKTNLHILL